MAWNLTDILAYPWCYHYLRQVMSGGLPFSEWTKRYGLTDPEERVADLGCGPADILRYLGPGRRPAFYLGVDISDRYLSAADERAHRAGVTARFLTQDLDRLQSSHETRQKLLDLLAEHDITRVLLLGIIHHIDDDAALTVLDLLHRSPTVRTVVTQDVVLLPGWRLNNFLSAHDRGTFVRDESGYDRLARRSAWPTHEKFWTSPGFSFIRYIHYALEKGASSAPTV